MTAHWEADPLILRQQYLDLDEDFLINWAEAVFRIDGESEGADNEVALAQSLGLPVFYLMGNIPSPKSQGHPLFNRVVRRLAALHRRKAADYGSSFDTLGNINACGRMGISPLVGVAIRLQDKMARLESFVRRGELYNESIEDTMGDIAVYAIIGQILLRDGL